MISKIKNFLVNDEEIEAGWQRFLSLFFLFLSGLMSFFTYKHIGRLWDSEVTFAPGFISTLIGIVAISPLYLRCILKWNRSVYTIISFILLLVVFSSFIELAMGGNKTSNVTYILLTLSIVLSWIGIRGVAGLSWLLLLVAAVFSATSNNLTIGFYGFIYVCCGFLGLLMHTGLNPGSLIKSIKEEYSSTSSHAVNIIREDIRDIKDIM